MYCQRIEERSLNSLTKKKKGKCLLNIHRLSVIGYLGLFGFAIILFLWSNRILFTAELVSILNADTQMISISETQTTHDLSIEKFNLQSYTTPRSELIHDNTNKRVTQTNVVVPGIYNETTFGKDASKVITYKLRPVKKAFWKTSACDVFVSPEELTSDSVEIFDTMTRPIFFNVSFSCYDLFKHSHYGTGNYMLKFYLLRLSAQRVGNVDVSLICHDALNQSAFLILPWLMGYFPRSTWNIPARDREQPTVQEACFKGHLGFFLPEIRYDLRRMAIAIIGIPHQGHPSEAWAEKYLWSSTASSNGEKFHMQVPNPDRGATPLVPNIELDDAVIHFRCGDIVEAVGNKAFGFMKFTSIAKYLSPSLRSIGIATQPFDTDAQTRSIDNVARKQSKCRKLVYALRDFLRQKYPDEHTVRISIRNDPMDTITTTFARMTLANETVFSTSTFGVFAALATFGTSYILNRIPNSKYLQRLDIDQTASNIKLIDEPLLPSRICHNHWGTDGEKILDWFQNEVSELDHLILNHENISIEPIPLPI